MKRLMVVESCFLFFSERELLESDFDLLNLVRGCLRPSVRERLTAEEALAHPYFQDVLRLFSSFTFMICLKNVAEVENLHRLYLRRCVDDWINKRREEWFLTSSILILRTRKN